MSSQIVEPLGNGLSRVWELRDTLLDVHTGFQHVVIGTTAQGVSLFCDGERQSTEASQLVYHEALAVPAMLLADKLDAVLVIGSSEGVVSRLAVAHGASRVDHVDIDSVAVRACAEHLPYGYSAAELAEAEHGEGPVRVHYQDGWEFLAASPGGYDLVVIDLPDENDDEAAQHNRLYGTEFLSRCAAALAPGGVVVCQAGCPTLWRNETLIAAWRRFTALFGTVAYYGSDEHEWAFLSGRADRVPDPIGTMVDRLDRSAYRPASIDGPALRACGVPPYSVRASCLPEPSV
ncbi:spermidine synthase [Prauserella marina]|uniref:Polyamine aminopropyltransferase n=1 Tax=Prauserella marina TaxID=530584 RepID=A0A222VNW2_9PSEU|nr:spermidine synthase [Prauserella marina]ASR35411.1 spermidine synthase [Prauserella marina]PWV84785.1 spermidine synthase [Prauserella marina]SDC13240.1 spermidine synthase [Prauserella marina]